MTENHLYKMGLIGNCAYMAYINDRAQFNWMCWPKFDSSFIFGNLLDDNKGGEFSVRANSDENYTSNQYYIENTNVLCTEFESDYAKFKVTDFAPRFEQHERAYKPLMVIRKIEPIKGTPRVVVKCEPKGNYGEVTPEVTRGSNHIRFEGLEGQVRLTTDISMNYILEEKPFVLNETKYVFLTWGAPLEGPVQLTAEDFLSKTITYWRKWVKSTSIGSFSQKEIIRSALVLKIHQYEDTGAIIASGTTSLPEAPGSGRNWDYRYCWMRDSYYTLTAFNHIGHFEELERYFHYIENTTVSEEGRFQPLYSITGEKDITEHIYDLEGYQGNNKPVRIGNQASEHIQNDVYGQVIVSLLPLYVDSRFIDTEKITSNRLINHALDMIEETMNEPDAGLWEFRNLKQEHCYTFLFHWAGACAAEKIATKFDDKSMLSKAERLKKIAAEKIEECYINDPKGGYYSQAIGTDRMDASCLQLITMGYLDHNSERARTHLKRLEEELGTEEGLFYRYKHEDDFGAVHSTFLICAYWYIEALATVGRVDEAIKYFDNITKYKNHVGLLSEDVNSSTGSQWGNFPQTYSHVGQVNAAYRIAKKLDLPNFK
ncbi:MAG: glycoside hydrolase family 15 protein [Cyclobacteriaceae bacterium]